MNHYEIENCVINAKSGSQEDLLKVLQQYKPFIFKTARNYRISSHDINDLEQIGYMAVINALEKYKTGSCTFSSYAYESIKNAFRYTARQNLRHQHILSLNSKADPNRRSSEYINFIDSEIDTEDTILKCEEASDVKRAVAKLPPQDMELVVAIYFNGVTLKDYAEKKGITYYQASKKKDFVLYKLGRQFKQ